MAKPVVVIGAGCAGLSAAVRLAAGGCRVLVVEQAPRLGGRATAFTDRVTGARVDNGQHALFGCYRETYAFLRTLGTDGLAPLDPQLALTMADVDGGLHQLTCPSWPAPWHLLAGALRWSALSWGARVGLIGLRHFFDRVRRHGVEAAVEAVSPTDTVHDWLRAHGQGAEVCRWLWEPLTLAALNQRMEHASARVFARVIGELFGGDAQAAAVGVPRVPLDALYAEPAAAYVRDHGGEVRVRSRARVEVTPEGRLVVWVDGTAVEAASVVVASAWHALPGLWRTEPPAALGALVADVAAMAPEPIVTTHLWFNQPVLPARQVGLVGTTYQWAFQGDVVSMVASGATAVLRHSNAELTALAVRELQACLPTARGVQPRHAVVVREPRATFAVPPGSARRPDTRTAVRGLYLAGDWTNTGLPATIEGAVRSGHAAADAVLGDGAGV